MSKVYGIDLGTTYSAIATLNENGLPEIIENFADSKPLLASAVYFPEGDAPVVGETAKGQLDVTPHLVVQFVKRQIGKPDARDWTFDGEVYNPIKISSLILKRMAEYAGEQGHEVKDVVLTCPAYFGNEERIATRQAGKIAGLNVIDIVNEPTSAAFNYLTREFSENRKIMVYDLGGGTFDITLFDISVEDDGKKAIDVIRTGGDDRLGGAEWDARLFSHIADLYCDENGIDHDTLESDGELKQKIRMEVEAVKIALSQLQNRAFVIKHDGDTSRLEVTREKFEEITNDLVERTINYVNELLTQASVSAEEVDIVLLVGGSTKMPMIKTAVEAIFPGKVRFEDPDLAVAKGAAIAAAIEFNERIRKFIEREQQGGESGTGDNEPPLGGGMETLFDEDEMPETVEEAKQLLKNVVGGNEGGFEVNDILTRAIGTSVMAQTGETILDNLLYDGDRSPSEKSENYIIPGAFANQPRTSVFVDPIYESKQRQGDERLILKDAQRNVVENDPKWLVRQVGQIEIEIPPNSPSDTRLEYTICVRGDGVHVSARNFNNNQVFNASVESPNLFSKEQLEEEARRMSEIKTRGM